MKRTILTLSLAAALLCAAVPSSFAAASEPVRSEKTDKAKEDKNRTQTVVFATNLHCHKCVQKINETIGFEKGVTDIDVSLERQRIKVTFKPAKTSVEKLAAAIRRLGYIAEVVEQ